MAASVGGGRPKASGAGRGAGHSASRERLRSAQPEMKKYVRSSRSSHQKHDQGAYAKLFAGQFAGALRRVHIDGQTLPLLRLRVHHFLKTNKPALNASTIHAPIAPSYLKELDHVLLSQRLERLDLAPLPVEVVGVRDHLRPEQLALLRHLLRLLELGERERVHVHAELVLAHAGQALLGRRQEALDAFKSYVIKTENALFLGFFLFLKFF